MNPKGGMFLQQVSPAKPTNFNTSAAARIHQPALDQRDPQPVDHQTYEPSISNK